MLLVISISATLVAAFVAMIKVLNIIDESVENERKRSVGSESGNEGVNVSNNGTEP